MWVKPLALIALVSSGPFVAALGEPRVISFPDFTNPPTSFVSDHDQIVFGAGSIGKRPSHFTIASKYHHYAAPILLDSSDNIAIHIAAKTFAEDVYRVTGVRPDLYNDTLPDGTKEAIIVGSVSSGLVDGLQDVEYVEGLKGKWESYDMRVKNNVKGVEDALVIVGSDRRGTIYALYTISEQIGVSPWHFWSDVPVRHHDVIEFNRDSTLSHGEPTVKYRGLFINDEHPALWGWAQEYFKRETWEAAFQTDFYAPWFEMMLRLKANYHWPAMYISMFGVDGLDGVPDKPIPGPNQVLANDMGIVMGLSHHEPMDRTKPEWDHVKVGPWDWTNKDVLVKHWTYGAERAKDREVLFTMGMRGDGDEPLSGASIGLVENITATQLDILKSVYGEEAVPSLPKMWAMYKEVADYYVDGLEIPDDITILFSDDNWGNLMSVLSPEKPHPAGAGIYYHVDYVGLPRAYKWINTINLAKTWEQMNIARSFNTTQIWIVNVGSLKPLEMPSEHFLSLAYDFDAWPRGSVRRFLEDWATRDFGEEVKEEVGDIMLWYGRYASRSKPELLNSTLWSLLNYEEAERIQADWDDLTVRAKKVHDSLPKDTQPAFYQSVFMLCEMQANINKLYIAVGRSNLYASQSRNAANKNAHEAIEAFKNDARLIDAFHSLNDGRWDHMLDQTHIDWYDALESDRDTLPPVSFVNPHQPVLQGIPVPELTIPHSYSTRVTVENSYGAWPGRGTSGNCRELARCPDPTFYAFDPYGAKTRWIDIGAGGPKNVQFSVDADSDWIKLSQTSGKIKRDASTDQRVYVSVDWSQVPTGQDAIDDGHVFIKASDGANVTITVPIINPPQPADDFHGHIQGDGYVVMEAAHFTSNKTASGYAWEEMEGYGRTLSGLEMFPTTAQNFTVGKGPSLAYDFWSHQSGGAVVTVQIGPSLNFIFGKQISFGLQLDDKTPHEIQPVTTDRLGGVDVKPGGSPIFVGAVPPDWQEVVSADLRNVTVPVTVDEAGKHSVTLWGMTAGVVVERLWVDFGGISQRGYSCLGPPESVRV